MDPKQIGRVYLIGAGPGDPRLITVRGKECLSVSDVVVYDYLAPESLLAYCRPETVRVFVGKRRQGNRLSQGEINALLIHHAREGRVVSRLKGGDPLIFGRGGEEAEALVGSGIPFEIVPGVTAAVGVPAYAGIPLTHRDWTSSVAFIAGHEDPEKAGSQVDWEKIATGVGTLVFYMGVRNLPYIVERLTRHGRPVRTPVALVQWGTLPAQRTVLGTLADIVEKAREALLEPPVTIVVGEVARLHEKINWYERLPLFGKRIVITRAEGQVEALARELINLGGDPVHFPTIAIVPPSSWEDLDQAIDRIESYDWLILTSVNGVQAFFERLFGRKKDARALGGLKLCAIGPQTADAAKQFGIQVDCIPSVYTAEGVLEALAAEPFHGKKVLLARAKVAREILPEELRRRGAEVTVAAAYETVRPDADVERIRRMLTQRAIDLITFTSASTVRHFAEALGSEETVKQLNGVPIAAIGPITARAVEELGLRCAAIAEEHTVKGLIASVVAYFAQPQASREGTHEG